MQLWKESMPYYDRDIDFVPYLTPYIVKESHLGVVVCPGGGYGARAEHEGDAYAEWSAWSGIGSK